MQMKFFLITMMLSNTFLASTSKISQRWFKKNILRIDDDDDDDDDDNNVWLAGYTMVGASPCLR